MKHTFQSAVHDHCDLHVTCVLRVVDLYKEELYMHEYYVHTISIQPVVAMVVTLIKLLHHLKPLIIH